MTPYCCQQEELHMTKEEFQARFGDEPRRDDMTLLNPKQDDPTEQVKPSGLHQSPLIPSGYTSAAQITIQEEVR